MTFLNLFLAYIFVFVFGQQLLHGLVEQLGVAFGVVDHGVGQILVVGGQVVQVDLQTHLLAIGNISL